MVGWFALTDDWLTIRLSLLSVCLSVPRSSIFHKLLDPAQYTGAHRHRFEPTEDGWRGRGIVGRTLEHEQWAESGIAGILNRKPATIRGLNQI